MKYTVFLWCVFFHASEMSVHQLYTWKHLQQMYYNFWILSSFSNCSFYPHLGCDKQADFICAKMRPFEGSVLCELQRNWQAAAVCGTGPRAHRHHLEMAGRQGALFIVVLKTKDTMVIQTLYLTSALTWRQKPSFTATQHDTQWWVLLQLRPAVKTQQSCKLKKQTNESYQYYKRFAAFLPVRNYVYKRFC